MGKEPKKIHQIGIEPTSVAPEAAALSTELLVHARVYYTFFEKVSRVSKKLLTLIRCFAIMVNENFCVFTVMNIGESTMDENKKQDGLFHWNFDLKNTDSDFTDIEYSSDTIPKAEGENDIKPFIFVDGNYKSDKDSSPFAETPVQKEPETVPEKPQSQKPFRRPGAKDKTSADNAEVPETPAKRKTSYFDKKKKDIRWKPILICVAVLALIVLLLIIFWPKKDKNKEWEVNSDKDIEALITGYFKAKTDGDASAMRKILVSEANVNSVALAREQRLYQAYNNIRTYSYPGIKKGETALLVTYDSEFKNIDTQAPTLGWFYTKQDATAGELRLITTGEMTEDSEEYRYIKSAYEKSEMIQDVVAKVQNGYKKALESDSVLAYYIDLWSNSNSNELPTRPATTAATTTVPPNSSESGPDVSTTPVMTTPDSLPPNEVKVDYCAYISDDGVRMRRTPSTDTNDNILTSFNKGYYLQVIGELDGWYHVKDTQTSNGMGQTQEPSGMEGYVSKDFMVKYQNQLGN